MGVTPVRYFRGPVPYVPTYPYRFAMNATQWNVPSLTLFTPMFLLQPFIEMHSETRIITPTYSSAIVLGAFWAFVGIKGFRESVFCSRSHLLRCPERAARAACENIICFINRRIKVGFIFMLRSVHRWHPNLPAKVAAMSRNDMKLQRSEL